MKPTIAISSMLLLASADAPAYPNTGGIGEIPKNAEWYLQCQRVEKAAPPAGDVAAAPPAAATKGCDAQALYYDTKNQAGAGQADWRPVRQCALATGDDGVLMMLYANGLGVARHPELALKHACSLPGAGAEMSGRVAHLLAMAKGGKAQAFDLCDDITSGYMQGVCAAIAERQQAKGRNRQVDATAANMPAQHQAALGKLQLALDAFAQARGNRETDLGGTAGARAALAVLSGEAARLAQDIADFEQGKTPRFSEAQFDAADRQLNAVYQQIMKLPDAGGGRIGASSTVTKDNVRQTQRAWLKYRDALVAYGAAKYPAVPAHAWQGMLTQRRAKQLTALVAD